MKINIHMQKSNHFFFFSSSKYFTIHEKNASNIWTSCIRFLYYSIYSEIIEFRNYASKARENFRVSSRGKRRKREGVRERERESERERGNSSVCSGSSAGNANTRNFGPEIRNALRSSLPEKRLSSLRVTSNCCDD